MMSLADRVLAAIRGAAPALTVHDAYVPRRADGTPLDTRYIVVYPDLPELDTLAMCADVDTQYATFRLVYVGTTRSEVESFCKAVRTVIVNQSFDADGWRATFDPDRFHKTTPVAWDESIADRVVMYATDEFQAICQKV